MDSLSVGQTDSDESKSDDQATHSATPAGAAIAAGTDQLEGQPWPSSVEAPKASPVAAKPESVTSTPALNPKFAADALEPEAHAASPRINLLSPQESSIAEPAVLDLSPEPTPAPVLPLATPPPVAPPPPPPVAGPKPAGRRGGLWLVLILLLFFVVVAGGGAWWYLSHRSTTTANPATTPRPAPTTPAATLEPGSPTGLIQLDDQNNPIAAAGTTSSGSVNFSFVLNTPATTGQATPQVEVLPLGQSFTGSNLLSGSPVTANGKSLTLKVAATGLKNGQYHWRARVMVGTTAGAWTNFGSGTTADFTVALTGPTLSGVTVAGQTAASGQTLTVTGNQPVIAGQAGAGDQVAVVVGPENIGLNATASSSGAWSITPTSDLPNGAHTVQITVTDSSGATTQLSFNLTLNPIAAAPTEAPAKLAPTGDPVTTISLIALLVLIASLVGLTRLRVRE